MNRCDLVPLADSWRETFSLPCCKPNLTFHSRGEGKEASPSTKIATIHRSCSDRLSALPSKPRLQNPITANPVGWVGEGRASSASPAAHCGFQKESVGRAHIASVPTCGQLLTSLPHDLLVQPSNESAITHEENGQDFCVNMVPSHSIQEICRNPHKYAHLLKSEHSRISRLPVTSRSCGLF